MSKEFK